mmetsp:Transcript_52515/g.94189  ORF Transcript_52515/g.94189 Transcript_52515/m.94189 type:complete len:447 (-) Transcript_52515:66-1406(-)|eukprot:CAMPEP_0197640808 /NCGR_PEP_ID=MMETSP1338-20131121/14965_1 /TAXON_ID=43686 ORGANISM="Pelagodinium beii, Strain RCC1491" /NCGR_SAMPLE_ID=MMETSP1338 /ASSEMBLY_ACC=CAM_ASM_000754 /LENGTH=446 /DNA_ID=CAMNT_0043213685 /DNA_START=65 /DNA_END=1405 /DNA_ORIENTATION=+
MDPQAQRSAAFLRRYQAEEALKATAGKTQIVHSKKRGLFLAAGPDPKSLNDKLARAGGESNGSRTDVEFSDEEFEELQPQKSLRPPSLPADGYHSNSPRPPAKSKTFGGFVRKRVESKSVMSPVPPERSAPLQAKKPAGKSPLTRRISLGIAATDFRFKRTASHPLPIRLPYGSKPVQRRQSEGEGINPFSFQLPPVHVPAAKHAEPKEEEGNNEDIGEIPVWEDSEYVELDVLEVPLPSPRRNPPPERIRASVLAKNYNLDLADVNRKLAQFDSICADKSGTVQGADFQAFIRKLCGFMEDTPLPPHLFDRLLCAEGSRVSRDDFIGWYRSHQWAEELLVPDPQERLLRKICRDRNLPLPAADLVKHIFDQADVDKSGYLDFEEFRRLVTFLEPTSAAISTESKLANLWREVDLNGDGTVDCLEFIPWYMSKEFDAASVQKFLGG